MLRCRRFLSLPLLLLLHHLLLLDLVVHAEYLVFKMLFHGVYKAHLIHHLKLQAEGRVAHSSNRSYSPPGKTLQYILPETARAYRMSQQGEICIMQRLYG